MTETSPPTSLALLDGPMQRRAVCLRVAAEALTPRGFPAKRPDAMDLVNVASWVETGQDPWGAAVGNVQLGATLARIHDEKGKP